MKKYLLLVLILSSLKQFAQWSPEHDSPTGTRNAVGFTLNGNGYVCMGATGPNTFATNIWKFTPGNGTQGTWNTVPTAFTIGRQAAVAVTHNNIAYIGLGENSTSPYYLSDWYSFDGTTITTLAPFPGTARSGAIAFVVGTRIYVGYGYDGTDKSDMYYYDINTGQWSSQVSLIGNTPHPRNNAISFNLKGKGYMGLGSSNVQCGYADLYVFDETGPQFIQLFDLSTNPDNNFPAPDRAGAVAINICDSLVLIGSGVCNSTPFYSFTLFNPSWSSFHYAPAISVDRYDGVGFAIDGNAYFGTGNNASGNTYLKDFNKFHTLITCSTVGISGIDKKEISLSPNPATNIIKLNLEQNLSEGTRIQIFDCLGRLMQETALPANNQIQVSELTNGIYFINLLQQGAVTGRAKFVKE